MVYDMYVLLYLTSRDLNVIVAFTLEDELPDYDCDEEDKKWLQSYNKANTNVTITTLELEQMVDTLEKGCGSRIDVS